LTQANSLPKLDLEEASMAMVDLSADVERVRRFNRFYTRRIGVLDEGHLGSGFTLTETRLLYEAAHADALTAKDLRELLGLDAGYVSRMLRRLEDAGLLQRRPDPADARSARISLTPHGRALFERLDRRTQAQIGGMLGPLSSDARARLSDSLQTIHRLLERPDPSDPISLRPHRPGDMGWVIARHGEIYAAEQGWGEPFEGLVAGVCADFIAGFDPRRERCWIAERDGQRLGSIFLVKATERTAKLRLLLVEPAARGSGLGRRLVQTCIAFAHDAGYGEITLWTHTVLTAARRIYRDAGFELIGSEVHSNFGVEVEGETWALKLQGSDELRTDA
jgi:DNA-binding MarR family transcriptional regulator/GNAT superfamily N-acetyltransferase